MPYKAFRIFLFSSAFPHYELDQFEEQFFGGWLNRHHIEDDRLLHHYTDLNGLRGILNERALRMSHYSTMNDPSELEYGKQLFVDAIEKLMASVEGDEVRKFLQELIRAVRSIGQSIHDVFFTCLCENDDLLSQWRGYSQRGAGYNLGFRFSDDTRWASGLPLLANNGQTALRKVIYDETVQREVIDQYLSGLFAVVQKMVERRPRTVSDELAGMLFSVQGTLTDLVLSFKNPAFSEEAEWRLFRVVMDHHEPERIGFNFTETAIRPYRQVWLFELLNDAVQNFPVFQLTAGPAHDPTQSRFGLRSFLHWTSTQKAEVPVNPHITVKSSKFRFRN